MNCQRYLISLVLFFLLALPACSPYVSPYYQQQPYTSCCYYCPPQVQVEVGCQEKKKEPECKPVCDPPLIESVHTTRTYTPSTRYTPTRTYAPSVRSSSPIVRIYSPALNIPKFPWPPPNASAFAKIPSSILSSLDTKISLANVANKLEAALDHTGYSQKKYYQVPDGFALVSQLEQFNPDGTSKDLPDRWAAEFRPPRIFSLKSYIEAIFTANPGQYRIVAFIVTSQPFEESEETVTREEAMEWLDSGMIVLPKSIGEQPYTDEHYCTALIYEFELPGKGKEAFFKKSSELSGKDHLKKSKLWAALEQ